MWTNMSSTRLKNAVNILDTEQLTTTISYQLFELGVVEYFHDVLVNGVNIHNLTEYMENMSPADDFFFDVETFYEYFKAVEHVYEDGILADIYIIIHKIIKKYKKIPPEDRRGLMGYLEKAVVLEFIKYIRSKYASIRRNIAPINKYDIDPIQPSCDPPVDILDMDLGDVITNSIIVNKLNIENTKKQIINTYGNSYYHNYFINNLQNAKQLIRRDI